MRKKILSILTLLTLSAGVNAQNVNIPDANFKAYLVGNVGINTNGDTEIQTSEASAFTGAIDCSGLLISNLSGIESFTELTSLNCFLNTLTSLDVSNNTLLTSLFCGANSLATLEVSQNILLTELYCNDNLLVNVNISNLQDLTKLFCHDNPLTTLDVSNNVDLINLVCSVTNITSLVVSENPALETIVCHDCQLNSLDVANGNNSSVLGFYSYGNPSLSCIQVDAGFTPPALWFKDLTSSYSDNCSVGIDIVELKEVKIYPNPVQNELFIELENGQIIELNILDLSGKVVKSITNNTVKSIDVSGLHQGVYLLKVHTENGVSTSRFVKQ